MVDKLKTQKPEKESPKFPSQV
jgi:hypothetical protein